MLPCGPEKRRWQPHTSDRAEAASGHRFSAGCHNSFTLCLRSTPPNLHLWRGPNSNPAGSRSRKTSVKLFCQRGKTTSTRSTCMPTLATLAAQLRTLSTIFHATLPTPVISHPLRTCRCHPELTLKSGLFCNSQIAFAEPDRYITSDVVCWTPAECGVAHMSIAAWEDTVDVLICATWCPRSRHPSHTI